MSPASQRNDGPLSALPPAGGQWWHVAQADCLAVLPTLRAGCADLVFADPPFNIGLDYPGYSDRLPPERYVAWTRDWLTAVRRVLSPSGSLFVQIAPRWAGHVQLHLEQLGLHWRNTVIWAYSFGPHQKHKFGPNHQQLLYYAADPERITFNADAVRVASDRQTKYRDKRADPRGRVPGDVWEFPRVCGTFKRRAGHVCQTPDELLDRVILACTDPGDLVVDPFATAGVTSASS